MNEAATTWALVVGIDQYDSPDIPALQGAVADALAAVSWLRQLGVPDGQILLNASPAPGSPSATALQAAHLPFKPACQSDIAALVYRLGQVTGTRLLVFLCGHGLYEPSSGPMFLVQDSGVSDQWPNLGLDAYTQKFLSLPFRRQFLFMDGCLNFPYPETVRQRFQAMGPVGVAAVTPRPDTTMVTCLAASMGERALERAGRGLFLSALLPQLNPAQPVPDFPDVLSYSFDDGTQTVDLKVLMERLGQQVQADSGGAQHPVALVKGPGLVADGSYPLFRVLPDPATVMVSLTVDPPHAAGDIRRLGIWIADPPFPGRYLYQPPPLPMPVVARLPQRVNGVATCDLPPTAPWDLVSARSDFTADADQTVRFTLKARQQQQQQQQQQQTPVQRSAWAGPQRFTVTVAGRDGRRHNALRDPAVYQEVARELGLTLPVSDQPVDEGVVVHLHEDGPVFTAEPAMAERGAAIAARWADALQAVLPDGLTVTTATRGDLAAARGTLQFQFPPGGARQLAGPLASQPAVVMERGPVLRPPAWQLTGPPAGMEHLMSLADLEASPDLALDPGPVRVSLELPWGSWSTTAMAPVSGTTQVELPQTVGVPPLRVALAGELDYLSERDRSGNPMILGLQGAAPQATLVSLLSQDGLDPAVVAAPTPSAAWGVRQPGLAGVLRLDGRRTVMFPLAGRSLAVDDADGGPRVEPLSVTAAAAWDLLIGTGQLEALDVATGVSLALHADDDLLRLAGAYVVYARSDWLTLLDVVRSADRPGYLDEALLALAAAGAVGTVSGDLADRAMEQISAAALQGHVPVLRWGIELALIVLTPEARRTDPVVSAWYTALTTIRPRLSPRSVWTAWTDGRR